MRRTKHIILCVTLATSLLGGAMVQASEVKMNTPVFSDVPSSHWAQSAIEWGVQQKITSGYEDGTFKPNKAVTEEEFITLLVRAYGIETSGEKVQRWSDPFYQVAADKNLPVSKDRTGTITRQGVANIIVGTQGVNFMGDDAVQYMLAKGLTQGKSAATIKGYQGQDTLTRAEAITFIKNVIDKVENKTMLARPKEPTPKSELPPLPVPTETTKPVAGKQIPLDSIIDAFNKASKDLGLSEEYVLVKDTFTPNTSSKESTIYDYYAKSPDGRVLDSYAF
ncbi:Cellulosome-anchoring protein precursor [compost metagenome]